MVKIVRLVALSLIVCITLIAQASWSHPVSLSSTTQSLKSKNNESKVLRSATAEPAWTSSICYMKTADGRITDLSKLCEKQSPSSKISLSSPSPYDTSVIKKFDDELYGEGN